MAVPPARRKPKRSRRPAALASGEGATPSHGSQRTIPVDQVAFDLERLVHELRTPLAAIQSTADALVEGHLGAVDPRHAGYLRSIGETARHALAVISGMARPPADVSIAETEPGAPICDLGALASEVVQGLRLLAERAGVSLDVGDDLSPAMASASPTDVRQMLINLVSNGIAHGGRGSKVLVMAGAAPGRQVWLGVEDNGPGMPRDVVERLETGAPPMPPVGIGVTPRLRLGLSLTRELAVANGGRLEITTGPAGTRARVILRAAVVGNGARKGSSRKR